MDEMHQELEAVQEKDFGQLDAREQSEEFPSNEAFQTNSIPQNGIAVDRQQLSKIFADFNQVATALDESYQLLEQRVSSLKRELSETRLARRWDQAEKDRLANRLASLVSVLPSAVLVLNKHGLIIDRNPLASDALNEPLIGLSWEQVLTREGVHSQAVSEASKQNQISLADGRVFSLAKNSLAVSSDTAVFLTDITDIHNAQNDMARNKRLTEMGEMAASMAHQIRTPLSAAHLYMSPLSKADLDRGERQQTVAKVQDRLSHIGKLVDSMLSFARGSKRQVKPIHLQEVLSAINVLVASETENTQAILISHAIEQDIYIEADAEDLVGALSNIVLNAFEMVDEHPEVLIDTRLVDQKNVEIKIRDKGPGIDPDKLERIFDPFYTTRSTGTGLGLAIAAMTCKEHGGHIYAQNHPQGGAEFVVHLPLVDSHTVFAQPEPEKTINHRLQREVA